MATQQLFNADCMEELPKYPDKYFDLAIVDPPYGSGSTLEQGYNRFGGRFDKYKKIDRRGGQWAAKYGKKVIAWDVAPGPEYFKELLRVSKNAIIWGATTLPSRPVGVLSSGAKQTYRCTALQCPPWSTPGRTFFKTRKL